MYHITATQSFILIIHVISWILFFIKVFGDSISRVSQTALIILYKLNQCDCIKTNIMLEIVG